MTQHARAREHTNVPS